MSYKFFFNLHIPKTGGTYFRSNILLPNEEIFNKNNIGTPPAGGEGTSTTLHWCWYPDFTQDSSYIYTNFRDPVKRIVSHYAWQAFKCVYLNKTNYSYDDINVNNFYKWIDEFYTNLTDFQSKNLIYVDSDPEFYHKAGKLSWEQGSVPKLEHGFFQDKFKNFQINKINLYDNFNRINLLVKSEDLNNYKNQEILINKIFNDLDIKQDFKKIDSSYANENHFSKKIYDSLNKNQIDKLYDMSKIDSELYFSDNMFYRFK